jgi:hypothetical protein
MEFDYYAVDQDRWADFETLFESRGGQHYVAQEYGDLKMRLLADHHGDRVAYTQAKGEFIRNVTERAQWAAGND